ncbi:MAG: hypothetical protein WCI74_06405, partial [Actinomycetes bacterium]
TQLGAGGTTTLRISPTGAVTGSWSSSIDCPEVGGCEVLTGLKLVSATFLWDTKGLSLTTQLQMATQGDWVPFTAAGSYASADDYNLKVNVTDTTKLTDRVYIAGFKGELSATPELDGSGNPVPGGNSTLAFAVTGTASGLPLTSALQPSLIKGTITNECSQANIDAGRCDPAAIHLSIDMSATTRIPGLASMPLSISFFINMETGEITVGGSAFPVDSGFAPPGLHINQAGFTLTNAAASGDCAPPESEEPDPSGSYILSLFADGTVLGQPMHFSGAVSSAGFCLTAKRTGTVSLGGVEVTDPTFIYSTYDTTLGGFPVGALSLSLVANYTVPQSLGDKLGMTFSGSAPVLIATSEDLSDFRFALPIELDSPVYIVGKSSGTNVSLSRMALDVTAGAGVASFTLDVNATFHIPSGPDTKNSPASDTPLVGSIDVSFSEDASNLAFSLNVDTSQGPLENAFGIDGLTILTLAVAGDTVGDPSTGRGPSMSFLGEVNLPDRWVSRLVLVNRPLVRLGFSLDLTNPENNCIDFAIGTPGSQETAFDLGGFGVVTAKYAQYVMAPRGCSLPLGSGETQDIPAGSAVAFDGALMGVPISAYVSIGFNEVGMVERGELTAMIPAIDFGAVKIAGYDENSPVRIHVAFDNGVNYRIAMDIDGSITVGDPSIGTDARIHVRGGFEETGSADGISFSDIEKNFRLRVDGYGDVTLLGIHMSNFYLLADVSGKTGPAGMRIESANVRAEFTMDVLAVTLHGGVALVYDNGVLLNFWLSISVRIGFSLAYLEGTVIVSYCRGAPKSGNPDDDFQDIDGCLPGEHDASGQCRPNAGTYTYAFLTGTLHFIFFTVSTTITIGGDWGPASDCTNQVAIRPGLPGKPKVVAGNGSAVVTVQPSVSGGTPDTYLATARNTSGSIAGSCSVAAGADPLECTVPGLTNGEAYSMTVAGGNVAGYSTDSEESSPFTPVAPPAPGVPGQPQAVAGDGTATVTVVPPLDASGKPSVDSQGLKPVSYDVKAYTTNDIALPANTCTVSNPNTSLDCTVSGLTNDSLVVFKATANWKIGLPSAESAASNPIKPRAFPSVPNPPRVEPGDSEATIFINAGGGGASPSSFQVIAYTQDPADNSWTIPAGSCFVQDPGSPQCVMHNLTNGTEYRASATASRNTDTSDPSGLSGTFVPAVPQGVPGKPIARAGDGQGTVTVTPPASGSADSYNATAYRQNPGDASSWNVASGTCSVGAGSNPLSCSTGLSNGTSYRFRVTSVSGGNESAPSVLSEVFTPQPVPGTPGLPAVVAGNRTLTVTMERATSGGAPDYYAATAYDGTGQAIGSCTIVDPNANPLVCVIRNLPNDVPYTVVVTAVNGAGSTPSPSTDPITPSTTPDTPGIPRAVVGDRSVTVTVTPAATGGRPLEYQVKGYDAQGAPVTDGTCTVAYGTAPLACAVPNLTNGEGYTFKTVARNSVGDSLESVPTPLVKPGTPAVPGRPSATLRTDSSPVPGKPWAQVSFAAAPGGGSPASYTVQ